MWPVDYARRQPLCEWTLDTPRQSTTVAAAVGTRHRSGTDPLNMFDADVLIVGAGPVGLLSALALAQNGASVIVVEADSRLNDSPRAAVYFPSTLGALRELGVLDDLEKRGFRNLRLSYHVPGLDFHVMISLEVLHGITFDYVVHAGQDVIDEIAMAHAQPLGVSVLFDHRLTGVSQRNRASAKHSNEALRVDPIAEDLGHRVAVDFQHHRVDIATYSAVLQPYMFNLGARVAQEINSAMIVCGHPGGFGGHDYDGEASQVGEL